MLDAEKRAVFDRHLEEILDGLPPDVRELLEEISLVVDDEPSEDVMKALGISTEDGEEPDVCGLHSGIPLSSRSILDGDYPEPELIRLFRGPIFRLAGRKRGELRKQIQITLLHELGHHFGLSEERLAELGYD
jgi:predicted Zn-dependent protease with MMP-like domain